MVIEHQAQRRHERLVVLERFAHAHKHDIADHPLAVGLVSLSAT
jgi:hypothetical protein